MNNSIQRVALYARVSTNGNQNPEMQLRELRAYAYRRGWQIAREFVDQGISGSKERRPELDRMLSECRKRRFDVVVVYRYDRFARSLRQLVTALDEFRVLGMSSSPCTKVWTRLRLTADSSSASSPASRNLNRN